MAVNFKLRFFSVTEEAEEDDGDRNQMCQQNFF